jgi:hypothetical protein
VTSKERRRAGRTLWAWIAIVMVTRKGLASLATDVGDWHRAAMLHGAAQALLDKTGVQLEPLDDRHRQESLGQARAAVGDEQVQRAYARGMTLSLDQVIDLALGGVLPRT